MLDDSSDNEKNNEEEDDDRDAAPRKKKRFYFKLGGKLPLSIRIKLIQKHVDFSSCD